MGDYEHQQSDAYQDGYHDFRPGQPKSPCPHRDAQGRSEWERGWTDACTKYLAEDRE